MLENYDGFKYLVDTKMDLRCNMSVDADGNTCLHLAAKLDLPSVIDLIFREGREDMQVDHCNSLGQTAATVGALHGSYSAVKLLHLRHGASARVALDGKYWGWLLALALKEVRKLSEKNN